MPTQAIWIVQGDHWNVPIRHMTAHTIREQADVEAARLVNILARDAGLKPKATPENWRGVLDIVKNVLDEDQKCDVWINILQLETAPDPIRDAAPQMLETIQSLLRWAEQMGRSDAPCWGEAERMIGDRQALVAVKQTSMTPPLHHSAETM